MSREQQLAEPNQRFLQSFVGRGALVYRQRLDGLACSHLFSMGDEVLFAGAVGNTDGSEHNLVFLEGTGAPAHLDGGPYRLPADTWRSLWPLGPDLNTFWHEVNHALLDAAGLEIAEAPYAASLDNPSEGAGMRGRTALTSVDGHHPFIEGVGQRGSEAYGLLFAFEEAVRRADLTESEYLAEGCAIDHAVERQLWGEAHHRFSAFLKAMKRVANMPPEALGAYRQATGVFYSTAEQVAEFYRPGGMKRLQRGEALGIRPPAWVFFPDLMRMPVQIVLRDAEGRDLEQPGVASTAKFEIKDGAYRQELRVEVRARLGRPRLPRPSPTPASGGASPRSSSTASCSASRSSCFSALPSRCSPAVSSLSSSSLAPRSSSSPSRSSTSRAGSRRRKARRSASASSAFASWTSRDGGSASARRSRATSGRSSPARSAGWATSSRRSPCASAPGTTRWPGAWW
jgi:hypothetical protein